jgi:ABC-type transport system involved in multi-copper enzyme maturation permease subunit
MVLLIANVSAFHAYQIIVMFLTYVVCILSLLLWATPNVYSELESRNWLFITTRPHGRTSLLLGKFLAAVLSATLVCFIAVALSCLIVALTVGRFRSDVMTELASFFPKFMVIAGVACVEYAAVFSLIGVLFQRRAMVIATVYALANELLLASVPALVSQFSVRYHLVGLTLGWLGWFLPTPKPDDEMIELVIAALPLWVNLLVLALLPFFLLAVSIYVIRNREYITVDEV